MAIPVPVHFDGHNINIITEDSPSQCKTRSMLAAGGNRRYGADGNKKNQSLRNPIHGNNNDNNNNNNNNLKMCHSENEEKTLSMAPLINDNNNNDKDMKDNNNDESNLNSNNMSTKNISQLNANANVNANNNNKKIEILSNNDINNPPLQPTNVSMNDNGLQSQPQPQSQQNNLNINRNISLNDAAVIEEQQRINQNNQNNKNQMSSKDRQSLYKTELCREWSTSGWCYYNKRCSFAHGLQELRPVFRSKKWRTKRCRNWHTTGYCPYEHRCQFLHDQSPPRRIQDYASANARALVAAQQRMQPLYFHYQVEDPSRNIGANNNEENSEESDDEDDDEDDDSDDDEEDEDEDEDDESECDEEMSVADDDDEDEDDDDEDDESDDDDDEEDEEDDEEDEEDASEETEEGEQSGIIGRRKTKIQIQRTTQQHIREETKHDAIGEDNDDVESENNINNNNRNIISTKRQILKKKSRKKRKESNKERRNNNNANKKKKKEAVIKPFNPIPMAANYNLSYLPTGDISNMYDAGMYAVQQSLLQQQQQQNSTTNPTTTTAASIDPNLLYYPYIQQSQPQTHQQQQQQLIALQQQQIQHVQQQLLQQQSQQTQPPQETNKTNPLPSDNELRMNAEALAKAIEAGHDLKIGQYSITAGHVIHLFQNEPQLFNFLWEQLNKKDNQSISIQPLPNQDPNSTQQLHSIRLDPYGDTSNHESQQYTIQQQLLEQQQQIMQQQQTNTSQQRPQLHPSAFGIQHQQNQQRPHHVTNLTLDFLSMSPSPDTLASLSPSPTLSAVPTNKQSVSNINALLQQQLNLTDATNNANLATAHMPPYTGLNPTNPTATYPYYTSSQPMVSNSVTNSNALNAVQTLQQTLSVNTTTNINPNLNPTSNPNDTQTQNPTTTNQIQSQPPQPNQSQTQSSQSQSKQPLELQTTEKKEPKTGNSIDLASLLPSPRTGMLPSLPNNPNVPKPTNFSLDKKSNAHSNANQNLQTNKTDINANNANVNVINLNHNMNMNMSMNMNNMNNINLNPHIAQMYQYSNQYSIPPTPTYMQTPQTITNNTFQYVTDYPSGIPTNPPQPQPSYDTTQHSNQPVIIGPMMDYVQYQPSQKLQ